MFEQSDAKHLIQSMNKHSAILFVGAGGVTDCKTSSGTNLPSVETMCRELKRFLGYSDLEQNELKSLFTAFAIDKSKTHAEKKLLLERLFSVEDIPDDFKSLFSPCWFKVYTTNIDKSLEIACRTHRVPSIFKYPHDERRDVDLTLETLQIIHLHGYIDNNIDDFIFGRDQYARASVDDLPLYDEFIRDFSTRVTVFLGTSIQEPLFDQLLAKRGFKRAGEKELRPRSYIISPNLSKANADSYEQLYNIRHIQATTSDFCSWIQQNTALFKSQSEIVRDKYPSIFSYGVKTPSVTE